MLSALALLLLLAAPPEEDLSGAAEALEQNDFTRAAELLERLLSANPDHLDARFNLAFAYSQLQQDERAIAEYEKIVAEKPELPQARLNLGLLLLRQNRPAEAAEHLSKLAELRPQDAQGSFLAAHALLRAERYGDAAAAYAKALALDPRSAQAAAEAARALEALERYSEAADRYFQASEIDEQHAAEPAAFAERLEARGRLEEAASVYRRLLTAAPEDAALHERLGLALLAAERPAEAVEPLETAVRLGAAGDAREALAEAYQAAGRRNEALQALAAAADAAPNDAELQLRYANALLKVSRFVEAAGRYRAAAQADPQRQETWSGLAFSLFRLENYPGALEALAQAARVASLAPAAVYLRALAQDKLQLYEQAKASYEEFLAAQPAMEDEVWKARQRLELIRRVLEKR